ncbi:hypothetical protein NFJ02_11g05500 [Pycnococcus provasolii]
MAISGFSVGGAVAASVARTCAVQGEATCGQVRFRSFAALAPTPGLPIEQGGVGTRESMSNLTARPGCRVSSSRARMTAWEQPRTGWTFSTSG